MGKLYNDGRETPDMSDKGGSMGTDGMTAEKRRSIAGLGQTHVNRGFAPEGKMSHDDTASDGADPA
jgi:hypothetical protein